MFWLIVLILILLLGVPGGVYVHRHNGPAYGGVVWVVVVVLVVLLLTGHLGRLGGF